MKEKATKLIKVCRENATPIILSAAWLAAGVSLEVIRNKKKTRKFYSEQLDYIEQEALWSSENPEAMLSGISLLVSSSSLFSLGITPKGTGLPR